MVIVVRISKAFESIMTAQLNVRWILRKYTIGLFAFYIKNWPINESEKNFCVRILKEE